jgi:uncharacterized membrane protein
MARAEYRSNMNAQKRDANKSYAKRMSDNIAIAMIVYTLMLIFMVTPALDSRGMSIFPYFLLVFLVALAIPFGHSLERRWQTLDNSELSSHGLNLRFNFDRIKLWIAAIGLPLVISFVAQLLRGVG